MFRTLAYSVNPNFNKQSQFELFPTSGSSPRPMDSPRQRFFLKSLTLSLESLVVVGIVIVMSMVVSYSVGIEKGKAQRHAAVRQSKKNVPQKVQEVVVPAAKIQRIIPGRGQTVPPGAVPAVDDRASTAFVRPTQSLILEKSKDLAVIVAKDIEKFYTIQVASFKEIKFADQEASLLKRKGYDILVLPKGSHSIVCVGKFNQKEQAKTFSQKLKKQYKDCLVRSL